MNPSRATAGPIAFIMAVLAAGGMFYISMTQGLAMALAFALMIGALFFAFNSDGGGVYCLILAALFEGIYKALSPSHAAMMVKDIFLLILLLRLFWVSQSRRDFSWLQQPFTSAAVIFVAYCVALMFAPSTRSFLLALAGLRAWVLWMPVYFPVYQYFSSLQKITRFLTVVIFLMLPVSLYGIIQGNTGYEHLRFLPNFYRICQFYQSDYHPAEDENEGAGAASFEAGFKPIMNVRATSIHISPGNFGAMCTILILLSLGYAAYTPSANLRLWAIISALTAAGGLLASGSRAPAVGLVAGMIGMMLVARRKSALVAGIVLIAFVSAFFLRDLVGGGAIRLQHRLSTSIIMTRALGPMMTGLEMGLAHPFGNGIATGTGMGRMFYGAGLRGAEGGRWLENEFARALGELGFFGAAAWLFMVGGILWHCAHAIRRMGSAREGILAAGMFGGMVSVFTELAVGSALYAAHGGIYYWVFAAAIVKMADLVVARQAAEADADSPPPALRPTGSLGPTGVRPASPRLARPAQMPPRKPRPVPSPPQPGPYRRAPGAAPGPRPGGAASRESEATPGRG